MADILSTWNITQFGTILLGALALFFTVWKYSRERARLKVYITHKVYDDGGYSRTEKTEHGEISYQIVYHHIEIANDGERPTTITDISATTRPSGVIELLRAYWRQQAIAGFVGSHFKANREKRLPHVIEPGGMWSCRVPVRMVNQLRRHGKPKVQVSATCWSKPKLFRFSTHVIEPEQ